MAKETTSSATTEPAEFKITIDEFLSEITRAKIESKAGFLRLCQKEGISGMKIRSEWDSLFELFETQPVSTSWAAWVQKGGK